MCAAHVTNREKEDPIHGMNKRVEILKRAFRFQDVQVFKEANHLKELTSD